VRFGVGAAALGGGTLFASRFGSRQRVSQAAMARYPLRFGDLFTSVARSFQHTAWQPAVDAYRTPGGWVLKYELAGVAPSEVEVTVSGRTVTVRGARRDVRTEDDQQSFCMEISYNRFERSLELPCDLSTMDVATQYRDGMLLVRLTCKETTP
jgi:HSP20 family molecular chaperone IbpA